MQTELAKCPAAQALPLYTGYLGLPRFAVWPRRPEGLVVVAGEQCCQELAALRGQPLSLWGQQCIYIGV